MAKRDFLYGVVLTTLFQMTVQDYYGMEGYIEHVRQNWNEISFPVMATITALIWLLYIVNSRKTEKIVVKPGMEQVLSLREGDIVTIERKG